MKFNIVRSQLIEALKSVQNVVSGKGSLPILQNVLLEAKGTNLRLTTTDLDLSTVATVSCEVKEEGESTLPVKLLFNLISKAAEGIVEIEVGSGDQAVIVAGSARYRLSGKTAVDFPRLNLDQDTCEYVMAKKTLVEMLRKTSYAAAQDDTRRTLRGVLMSFKDGKLTMVATDGRRLAMVEQEIEFPQTNERDIILPSKAVSEIQRTLSSEGEVKIRVQPSKVCFDTGDVQIYSKLMDETYPNYQQVIPNECSQKIGIDRQLLLNALERASVMTMDEAHSTKLIFDENCLTVTSAASEIGEAKDEVPIKYAGEKIEIMFNPSYVMDPLRAIDDDEIVFNLNNGHSPAVIRCSIPFLYVLMPLRIG